MKKQIVTFRSFANAPKNVSKVLGNINTHIKFNNFFFYENRAIYEIMWRNVVIRVVHRLQYGACALHAV